eukprot:Gb_27000 [translate_table: standard]
MHAKPVQKLRTKLAFFGISGTNENETSRVRNRNPFSLHSIPPGRSSI